MENRVYLYPIWVRLWHLSNALLCLLLIMTGISMHYSDLGAGFIRFEIAVALHDVAGIILTASYFIYAIGNIMSKNGRYYRREPGNLFNNLWTQAKYYAFGIFKKEKAPFQIGEIRKFNPLQKITYQLIMYAFIPIIIMTGWIMFFPSALIEEYIGFKGFIITDLAHIFSAFVISSFLVIHLYISTMGRSPLEHYKSMITGYHEHHD